MKKNSEAEASNVERDVAKKEYDFGELLQNETRISILMYLRMNEHLSFSQIAELVGKSRSTVHHHLQKMIQGGIIRERSNEKPRDQFDPKFYELIKPAQAYSFDSIPELPKEQQIQALLTTTKIHKTSLFFLHRILELLANNLNNMEEIIKTSGESVDPGELLKMWEGTSEKTKDQPIKHKDIFIYNVPVSENVYHEYIRLITELQGKIGDIRQQEEKEGGSSGSPYFIYHIAAPLGKPYLLKSS